ncbi:hypothetical protein B0H19DRAFT_1236287 [Mycena capillaripes]|nr:hypothetical protein B0H19DRAFT_1236287 [Mycena capillaripes]
MDKKGRLGELLSMAKYFLRGAHSFYDIGLVMHPRSQSRWTAQVSTDPTNILIVPIEELRSQRENINMFDTLVAGVPEVYGQHTRKIRTGKLSLKSIAESKSDRGANHPLLRRNAITIIPGLCVSSPLDALLKLTNGKPPLTTSRATHMDGSHLRHGRHVKAEKFVRYPNPKYPNDLWPFKPWRVTKRAYSLAAIPLLLTKTATTMRTPKLLRSALVTPLEAPQPRSTRRLVVVAAASI